jgi:hypothetical protein
VSVISSQTKAQLTSDSWVDRDMFMRYSNGGPGHSRIPTCGIAWCMSPPERTQVATQQHHTVHVPEDLPSSESDSDVNGSEWEPDTLDLLEEEPISTLGYGF